MDTSKNPSSIAHALTIDILKGRYAAGTRLPTVRALAGTFDVNPATIQRAVSRLEARGLVTARQGSGLKVNDASETGDISLAPFWLEATTDDPARARRILAELLEMRRMIAARLMVRHREAILVQAGTLREHALRVVEAREEGLDAVLNADLAFARELLRATGNLVSLSVFNTVARVVTDLPDVAEAMYANPEENAESMGRTLEVLLSNTTDAEANLEAQLRDVDERTLERFEARLTERLQQPSDHAGRGGA